MRRAAAAILALALASAGSAASAASPAAGVAELLDRSQDRILQRADITARGRKHGEVRLIARGSAQVVQTLLYSRVLNRVVAEIRARERANWPVGRAGHEASERYLAALERAERAIPRSSDAGPGAKRERSRPLLIEFAVSNSHAIVALLEPEVERVEGALKIEGARLIEVLELPRDFVQQDMELIAEEHLGKGREGLESAPAPPE